MAAKAHHLDALVMEALSLHREGYLDRAETAYRAILTSDPKCSSVLTLLGTLCLQRGSKEEGLELIGRSLAINSHQPDAYNSRGNILRESKRYREALADYDRALSLNAGFPEAWLNRGTVLKEINRYADALSSFDRAIAIAPRYFKAYNNRANTLRVLQRHDDALRDYDKALSLSPNDAVLHFNRGLALAALNRYDEALSSCDYAITLKQDDAEAHLAKSSILEMMKRYDDALACCEQAIALKADCAGAIFAKACLQIRLGNWEGAWELYEWRWKATGRVPPAFDQPLWLGKEDLSGKTILLHTDHAAGDTIFSCRYIPMVESLGAKVIVGVPGDIAALISTASPTVQVVKGGILPPFDFHCPLMSLPLAFKTTLQTIPEHVPYLNVMPHKQKQWQKRLGNRMRPRIGLVWSGSGKLTGQGKVETNYKRNIPFSEFRQLIQPGYDYVALQKDMTPEDQDMLATIPEIANYAGRLDSYASTAALLSEIDLVISIDTSVAHLAGALGKPLWLLLNDPPTGFLWMLEREDSPWYPTARLFRQNQPGDWTDVLRRVTEELARLFSSGEAA